MPATRARFKLRRHRAECPRGVSSAAGSKGICACSSAGERLAYTQVVGSSILSGRTNPCLQAGSSEARAKRRAAPVQRLSEANAGVCTSRMPRFGRDCGSSSVVERRVANAKAVGSNPISRSNLRIRAKTLDRRILADSMSGTFGDVAQLGERLLCKQDVVGSIPSVSTTYEALA